MLKIKVAEKEICEKGGKEIRVKKVSNLPVKFVMGITLVIT
jgi:hypothetical protein